MTFSMTLANCYIQYTLIFVRYSIASTHWFVYFWTCSAAFSCIKIISSLQGKHCVKSVQIRSFFWSVFSCIRTKYGDLLRKSVRIQENKDQKNLRIWTLFTQERVIQLKPLTHFRSMLLIYTP